MNERNRRPKILNRAWSYWYELETLKRKISGALAAGRHLIPGLIVTLTISLAAAFLSEHYGAPAILFALFLGIAFNFVSEHERCAVGIDFSSTTILRCGVALLGFRITVDAMSSLGIMPFVVVIFGVLGTIMLGLAIARVLGAKSDLGILTGGAVAICGASAALAISSLLPKGQGGITERDTVVTIVGVTTLSTLAMIIYPLIAAVFQLDDLATGIFIGATIHDIAQVIGAGYSVSPSAGDAATITKLLRVLMLVPVALAILLLMRRRPTVGSLRGPLVPPFLLAFLVFAGITSLGLIPDSFSRAMSDISRWALVVAIAALGIRTSLKSVSTVDPRTFFLIGFETVAIVVIVLFVLFLCE